MKIKSYFDRVVLINLKRRPDRLARIKRELRRCRWPFKQPEIFEAVDGLVARPPASWSASPGAWGCLESHRQILSRALADGVKSILILEDDVCFTESFREDVQRFLHVVPDDWDQLMLGGQHLNYLGEPTKVKPGVLRCTDCERTHGYAIRGEFMRKLSARWSGGGKYNGNEHCDKIMGRDPEMQFAHKVYAPEFFLIGQDRDDRSDIFGAALPRKFWNPPTQDQCVINLHAPAAVVAALRPYGFCTGSGLHPGDDLSGKLSRAFDMTRGNLVARKNELRDWIKVVQWELAAEPNLICTVWHPQATPQLVRAASLWRVYEITASSVDEALKQLPPKLRRLGKQDGASIPVQTTLSKAKRRRKPSKKRK